MARKHRQVNNRKIDDAGRLRCHKCSVEAGQDVFHEREEFGVHIHSAVGRESSCKKWRSKKPAKKSTVKPDPEYWHDFFLMAGKRMPDRAYVDGKGDLVFLFDVQATPERRGIIGTTKLRSAADYEKDKRGGVN